MGSVKATSDYTARASVPETKQRYQPEPWAREVRCSVRRYRLTRAHSHE
jgi:hypothetical protein